MKDVILLVGIPGSGKSTHYENELAGPGVAHVNADKVREELYGDPSVQGDGAKVFSRVFSDFSKHLKDHDIHTVVIDNTNVDWKSRKKFYDIANDHSIEKRFSVLFFADFELAKKRNAERERVVPTEVLERMISRFTFATPWELEHCKVEKIS